VNSSSPEAQLNSSLALTCQLYDTLLQVLPKLNPSDVDTLRKEIKQLATQIAGNLWLRIDENERLLRGFTFDATPKDISQTYFRKYCDVIRPQREQLLEVVYAFFDIATNDQPDPNRDQGDIWILLTQGVDTWSEDDNQFSADTVHKAEALIYSSFFDPDGWVKNADEIKPAAVGSKAALRIPGPVRIRLRELTYSFILNNHLATIALARAILEYTLIDRAPTLGISPDNPNSPGRKKKLSWLANEVAEQRPNLKPLMGAVIESGNQTLHPSKKEKVYLLPSALRERALDCARNVRAIVEELYL